MADNENDPNEETSNKFDFLDVLGTTGLNRQAGQIDEEWLRPLQGDKGHKIYTDMSVSWPDFLAEVLSFLPYGWSFFEIIYKIRKGYNEDTKSSSNYSDGRVGWGKFAVRSQDTLFKWEFDEEGGLQGLWQMAPPNYEEVYIPLEKALHFRTETHKNNPEGRSILRNAYRSWYFLKRIQEIEAIGIERDLAGLPVMQVPVELLSSNATSSQKAVVDDFRDMIQKIRRGRCHSVRY